MGWWKHAFDYLRLNRLLPVSRPMLNHWRRHLNNVHCQTSADYHTCGVAKNVFSFKSLTHERSHLRLHRLSWLQHKFLPSTSINLHFCKRVEELFNFRANCCKSYECISFQGQKSCFCQCKIDHSHSFSDEYWTLFFFTKKYK